MSQEKLDAIDNCLFELLELVENFNEIRIKSNKELSSGYFNLAKSKYSLGAGTFTSLSYDKRMTCGAKITCEKEEEKELVQYKLGGEMYEKKVKSSEQKSENESNLKNRNNEEKTEKEETQVEEIKFRNPIYWYGVLVPQSLRSSQKDFKNEVKIKQNLDNEITLHQNTGNLVWDGAYILSKYLYRLKLRDKKCIELGCGTGLVGISAWTYGADVTLTDIEDVIPLVEENVNFNVDKVLKENDNTNDNQLTNNIKLSKDKIRIKTLNWGVENCKELDTFDIVFGSEILYYSKSHKALIETLQHICNKNTLCVFIYKTRNLGEEHFFKLAKEEGFNIEYIDNKKLIEEFQESEYHLIYMKKN
ncbi:hypothetical protein PIROE2DRAFT_60115 [Piromyces sp. E2]|nr:hypothetical protein PIROE2DRAFT_60115 [Piromyces sp. E2]|eukprot:OUM65320.1 hypothetical protein PIROE2DRAFT_60115 [Piromyces sp. E2]